jgi:TolB-like protein/tRNA A-37 threonylcarbamoyl transferase component Bud32
MIGRVIGHYRVQEQLGSGGMGVVHLAYDQHLKRRVALKFLPPSTVTDLLARQRLRREALALSRLAHPSIATLHDYISDPEFDCIVMEYVEGEPLDRILRRGPLPEAEVLRLGAQLADGLSAAHAAGVVHRDIKPGNLRVNTAGHLKILDFGLAKRTGQGLESTSVTPALAPQELTGTFPYIAPELWRGEPASPASDLYAAGVVLHEMATGSRPFPDLAGSALVHAMTESAPVRARVRRPAIGEALDAIIARCLERDPGRRFASAAELFQAIEAARSQQLVHALAGRSRSWLPGRNWRPVVLAGVCGVLLAAAAWWFLPGLRDAIAPRQSLAVLPLANLSGDPGQDYFVDGLTDELTARLAGLRNKRVISRQSMARFKNTRLSLPEIAATVGVTRVVQGSVRLEGERMRLSIQLIDGPHDRHLWSGDYPGLKDDAQELLDETTGDLAAALHVPIGARATEARAHHADPVTYNLVLRGRWEFAKRGPKDVEAAIEDYESALRRDSTFAPAYAGLADAWSAEAFSGRARPGDAYPRARRAAQKALVLDPGLSEGWASLANVQQNYEWDWPAAGRSFERALVLNPNNALAHHWYGNHLALLGDFDGAEREIRAARSLDPFSLPILVGVGAFRYFARRYARASEAYAEAAKLDSASGLLRRAMAATHDRLGRDDLALADLCAWLEAEQQHGVAVAVREGASKGGFRGGLEVLIAGMKLKRASGLYEPATHVAEIYSRFGERDSALRWLETAAMEHDTELNRLGVDPIFDPLRKDPRFTALLVRVRLDKVRVPEE